MPSKNTQLEQEQMKAKAEKFMELLKAAEKETGLGLVAFLDISPKGLIPTFKLLPLDDSKKEPRDN